MSRGPKARPRGPGTILQKNLNLPINRTMSSLAAYIEHGPVDLICYILFSTPVWVVHEAPLGLLGSVWLDSWFTKLPFYLVSQIMTYPPSTKKKRVGTRG